MTEKPQPPKKTDAERDEPVTIPLDPEVALRALLQVQAADDADGDLPKDHHTVSPRNQ